MSAVLKFQGNVSPNNIYLIYDFKQVNDSILVIMYVDKLHDWKKLFISYEDGSWDTSVLASCTDEDMYQQICAKLQFIFYRHEHLDVDRSVSLEKTMQDHAIFLLGIGSI